MEKTPHHVADSPVPNFEELSRNMSQLVEEAGKAGAAYFKPLETQGPKTGAGNDVADMVKTLGVVAERWLVDPRKSIEAQSKLGSEFLTLWASMLKRMQGEDVPPVASPEPRDNRFKDPEWSANPVFDFLKQSYLITSRWAEDLVQRTDDLDDHTRHKAEFYLKQISSAVSPSNFLATNPELIRETLRENGANLVRGMKMLTEDLEAGHGELKIRQTDPGGFKLGENVATTPGKVVLRNDLIELIQYSPTTETVIKRPIVIVPPWINKYYILDLNPEKSFIKWAVSQGLTVFCVSWVNPDERHANKDFEAYMREGVYAALDTIRDATGEEKVGAIGYCVGGTLLAVALAHMAASGDDRIGSATFFTTQVDFTHAGDLKVFADEDHIASLEAGMKAKGYLEGSRMANAFNMLRPNDLIWSYVVNNYVRGKTPFAFDLLYWNSDSTRMPAANHSFYLRSCYLENRLVRNEMTVGGVKLDLKRVTAPVFNLAAREDHIAPSPSVYLGSRAFGGEVEYVMAGSGHIAGVVNPPAKPKYQYWTGKPIEGSLDEWVAQADEHPGSWWPYWFEWLERQAPERVPAREPGGGKVTPVCDAPGEYVRMKA